jgi:hypothetical protein
VGIAYTTRTARRCSVADNREVIDYRVFHYDTGSKAGTSMIITRLEGEVAYFYKDLSPERAHHIVDLLRNEDHILVDTDSGLMQVVREPVGEGESIEYP